ncbi:hypothetical protein TorRG33x02_121340 [Trema orientale]|uniref:Uncharacterized protein n=1 Tax=Trema orientale TaxID=63057 RepID=A0A2P5F2R9_TREOI|nr:hypothetical protein TorRG33x02_121340 [Trema orientale]
MPWHVVYRTEPNQTSRDLTSHLHLDSTRPDPTQVGEVPEIRLRTQYLSKTRPFMGEPKAAQLTPTPTATPTPTQVPNPPSAASQGLPPQPPPSSNSRKRPLDNDSLSHNSKPFKLRLLLKGLRPHFLQVLRTPDFRNCKAANEIQEQVKIVVELYKQVISETISSGKNNATGSQPLSGESKDGQNQQEKLSEKPQPEAGEIKGTYVVGGSAFGWNFITFSGKDPVYYGVTKETFRTKVIPPLSR